MVKTLALLIVLALAGCLPEMAEPVADPANYWQATAERAVNEWNDGLVSLGCEPPLELRASTSESRAVVVFRGRAATLDLIARDAWALGPDFWGWFEGATIVVKDTRYIAGFDYVPGVLVHELGHLLGLGHDDAAGSVMRAGATQLPGPSDHDFRAAAAALGC